MTTVRAKFKCTEVNERRFEHGNQVDVVLYPVMRDDVELWEATPSGKLEMTVTNPSVAGWFKPGESYYLDFSRADETVDRDKA